MLEYSDKICHLLRQHNHELVPEISEAVDVTDFIVFKSTNRGGQCLFLNDFKFVNCSEKNGTTHYRCSNYTKKCRARIFIKDEKANLTGTHNHS